MEIPQVLWILKLGYPHGETFHAHSPSSSCSHLFMAGWVCLSLPLCITMNNLALFSQQPPCSTGALLLSPLEPSFLQGWTNPVFSNPVFSTLWPSWLPSSGFTWVPCFSCHNPLGYWPAFIPESHAGLSLKSQASTRAPLSLSTELLASAPGLVVLVVRVSPCRAWFVFVELWDSLCCIYLDNNRALFNWFVLCGTVSLAIQFHKRKTP